MQDKIFSMQNIEYRITNQSSSIELGKFPRNCQGIRHSNSLPSHLLHYQNLPIAVSLGNNHQEQSNQPLDLFKKRVGASNFYPRGEYNLNENLSPSRNIRYHPYNSTSQNPYNSTSQNPYNSTSQNPYNSTAQRIKQSQLNEGRLSYPRNIDPRAIYYKFEKEWKEFCTIELQLHRTSLKDGHSKLLQAMISLSSQDQIHPNIKNKIINLSTLLYKNIFQLNLKTISEDMTYRIVTFSGLINIILTELGIIITGAEIDLIIISYSNFLIKTVLELQIGAQTHVTLFFQELIRHYREIKSLDEKINDYVVNLFVSLKASSIKASSIKENIQIDDLAYIPTVVTDLEYKSENITSEQTHKELAIEDVKKEWINVFKQNANVFSKGNYNIDKALEKLEQPVLKDKQFSKFYYKIILNFPVEVLKKFHRIQGVKLVLFIKMVQRISSSMATSIGSKALNFDEKKDLVTDYCMELIKEPYLLDLDKKKITNSEQLLIYLSKVYIFSDDLDYLKSQLKWGFANLFYLFSDFEDKDYYFHKDNNECISSFLTVINKKS